MTQFPIVPDQFIKFLDTEGSLRSGFQLLYKSFVLGLRGVAHQGKQKEKNQPAGDHEHLNGPIFKGKLILR